MRTTVPVPSDYTSATGRRLCPRLGGEVRVAFMSASESASQDQAIKGESCHCGEVSPVYASCAGDCSEWRSRGVHSVSGNQIRVGQALA